MNSIRLFHPFCVALMSCAIIIAGCSGGKAPSHSQEYAVQGLYSAEFNRRGDAAIVGSINHGASHWKIANDERLYNWNHKAGEYSQIVAASYSPEGNYAITATPQTMVLWDVNSGKGITYWTAPSEILDITLLSNGNYALLGLIDHSAALFDVKNGGVQQVFYHRGRVTAVDSYEQGLLIVTGSEDYTARLWSLQSGKLKHQWTHTDEVQLVRISPDGTRVFTMAKYDKAAVWDVASGELIAEMPLTSTSIARGKLYTSVAFSKDSKRLLTGTNDRIVELWSIDDKRKIETWKMPRRNAVAPTSASVLALAFAEDGQTYYAITSDGFKHKLN